MSLIYSRKSSGPNINPWGTPITIGRRGGWLALTVLNLLLRVTDMCSVNDLWWHNGREEQRELYVLSVEYFRERERKRTPGQRAAYRRTLPTYCFLLPLCSVFWVLVLLPSLCSPCITQAPPLSFSVLHPLLPSSLSYCSLSLLNAYHSLPLYRSTHSTSILPNSLTSSIPHATLSTLTSEPTTIGAPISINHQELIFNPSSTSSAPPPGRF